MSKKVLIIVCILEALLIGYLLNEIRKTPVTPPDVPIKEIIRDSFIRDSIFIVNEKIKKEFVYIEKQADKDSAAVMSDADSILYSKFSRYIEDYNNK